MADLKAAVANKAAIRLTPKPGTVVVATSDNEADLAWIVNTVSNAYDIDPYTFCWLADMATQAMVEAGHREYVERLHEAIGEHLGR